MVKKAFNDHRGVSLVEILVVVAIIAIAGGLVTFGISFASSRNAEKCAKIIDSQLSSFITMSMSKSGTWTMTIDNATNQIEVVYTSGDLETVIMQEKVAITYEAGSIDFTGCTRITIVVDRASGKVKQLIREDGISTYTFQDDELPAVITIKVINSSGSKKADIVLVTATGKHYISY